MKKQSFILLKKSNNKEFLEPKKDRNYINDDFINKTNKNEDKKNNN